MRDDKEIATKLRRSGKSYRQIRDELRVPLATLSDWFKDVDWSKEVKQRLQEENKRINTVRIVELGRIRGKHLARVYEEAREEAREELGNLKYNPLFIAGLMLYWGGGTKAAKSQIRLANSDPELAKLFVDFLQKVCRIPEEKIKIALLSYADSDDPSLRRFWSFALKIPLSQFQKTVIIASTPKTRHLVGGVCTIVVSSSYFREKMLEWLKLLPKELMNKEYYANISSISVLST